MGVGFRAGHSCVEVVEVFAGVGGGAGQESEGLERRRQRVNVVDTTYASPAGMGLELYGQNSLAAALVAVGCRIPL